MGKKKKKSAEELAEEARIAAEQEAAERKAEEERLALERKRAEEAERKRQEEEARRREEEISRLSEEFEEEKPFLREQKQRIMDDMISRREQQEWITFAKCGNKPNPMDDRAINAYISEWKENEEVVEVERVLELCKDADEVCRSLGKRAANAADLDDDETVAVVLDYIYQLHQLILSKIDLATAYLLTHEEEYAGKKTEITLMNHVENVKYGMWVNLGSKAFRPRNVTFTKIGASLVLPKVLSVMDVGVRVLHFDYNHIIKTALLSPSETSKLPFDTKQRKEIASNLHEKWRKTRQRADGNYEPRYKESSNEMVDISSLAFDDLPNDLQLPYLKRVMEIERWTSLHNSPPEYIPIGGIFMLDILEKGKKTTNAYGWTLRTVTPYEKSVHRLSYPPEGTGANQIVQPIRVSFQVSPGYLLGGGKEITVGWWNEGTRQWDREGITDVSLDAKTRKVTFSTLKVGILALITPHHTGLPIKSFYLRPSGKGESDVQLTLVSQLLSVDFSINSDGCSLIGPGESELSHLIGKRMEPRQLIDSLENSGVNLRFQVEDAKKFDKKCKSKQLGRAVHQDIASLSAGFEIQSSNWNKGRDSDSIVFLLREAPEESLLLPAKEEFLGEPLALGEIASTSEDMGWRTLLYQKDNGVSRGCKCMLVDSSERDKGWCDNKPVQGETTHSYLKNVITRDNSAMSAMDATEAAKTSFVENVRKMLNILRPFSFD
eukprot:g2105.t1